MFKLSILACLFIGPRAGCRHPLIFGKLFRGGRFCNLNFSQTLKAFLEPMMRRNKGHIISVASSAGYAGSPGLVDYVASKFGAVGLMEALTMELWDKADGVNTTVVAPWFIKTGMFEGAVSALAILCMVLLVVRVFNS